MYCAGAYSADNILDIFQNMRIGISTATRLFANGFSPFCPWIDYHYLLSLPKESVEMQMFYRYSLDYLRVCHAMLIVHNPNNEKSEGLAQEIVLAKSWGVKVFEDYDKLIEWGTTPEAL